jgi:hypothetical protein
MAIQIGEGFRAERGQHCRDGLMQPVNIAGLPPRRQAGRQPRRGGENRVNWFWKAQARGEIHVYHCACFLAEVERGRLPEPADAGKNHMPVVAVRSMMPNGDDWKSIGIETDAFERVADDTPPVRCLKSVADW